MAWKFGNYPLAPLTRTDPQTRFQIHQATFSFDLILGQPKKDRIAGDLKRGRNFWGKIIIFF